MNDDLVFLVGFAFLLVHEMDAVRCREWTILPVLSKLNDRMGYVVFMAIHVPLYALLFRGLLGDDNAGLIVGLDVFLVVHLILHVLLRNHPENRFGSPLSWTLFTGAGVCGAIDLLLRI